VGSVIVLKTEAVHISGLSVSAARSLAELLQMRSILPFEATASIKQLLARGLATRGGDNRCIMRSPLIRQLLLCGYGMPQDLPPLTDVEEQVLELPQAKALILNDALYATVRDELAENRSERHVRQCEEVLHDLYKKDDLSLDLTGLQYFCQRYCKPPLAQSPSKEFVLHLTAKIFAKWLEEQEEEGKDD
jgi:hypothetical protein